MVRGLSFRNAFFVSTLAHLFLFVGGSSLYYFHPGREGSRAVREIEVSYPREIPSERRVVGGVSPKEVPVILKNETSVTLVGPSPEAVVSFRKEESAKGVLPKEAAPSKEPLVTLPEEKASPEAFPKKGTLSEEEILIGLHLSLEEKPLYLAYYQSIREKIRKSVYAHYPHGIQKGEVLLTFILFSDGKLKEIVAVAKDPFQDRKLKELTIRSVIDASPFSPFPEGFKRPFVPFRVMITFVGEGSY